jgi:hypothetical protein
MRHSLKGVKIESIILSLSLLLSLVRARGVNGPHKFISSSVCVSLEIGAVSEIEPISQASKSEERCHDDFLFAAGMGVNWSWLQICTVAGGKPIVFVPF